jgi:hypothetical protein
LVSILPGTLEKWTADILLRLRVICYELRSRRKLPSAGKPKRSWIKADW